MERFTNLHVILAQDWTGLVLLHFWGSKAKDSDTFARHAVLSCAVLTHSATDSSVQSLMSSVQRLRGLSRFLVPAIRPWRMDVQRLSALTTCPKYRSFLRCMSFSSHALVSLRRGHAESYQWNEKKTIVCKIVQ